MAIYELDGARPELPEDGRYFVAETAAVIGRVRLDRDATVWFGAVLRGDNELIHIGEGSNVQDGCVLHTDIGFPLTVGSGVTIGHQAMLHGCTVGDNSLIGMGATVLNGAVIGRNSIVGAHTLITEGMQVPDDALVVGTPGRVIRTLTEKNRVMLVEAAEFYVGKLTRYRASLRRID